MQLTIKVGILSALESRKHIHEHVNMIVPCSNIFLCASMWMKSQLNSTLTLSLYPLCFRAFHRFHRLWPGERWPWTSKKRMRWVSHAWAGCRWALSSLVTPSTWIDANMSPFLQFIDFKAYLVVNKVLKLYIGLNVCSKDGFILRNHHSCGCEWGPDSMALRLFAWWLYANTVTTFCIFIPPWLSLSSLIAILLRNACENWPFQQLPTYRIKPRLIHPNMTLNRASDNKPLLRVKLYSWTSQYRWFMY